MSRQCDSCRQKEYCRDAKNPVVTGCSAYWKAEGVKIRCDDCKFVENCVDYGWDGCKKFTPAPSGVQTNEEWLKEEKDTNQFACKMCELFEIRCTDCKFYDKSMRIGGCTLPSYLKEVHKE